METVSKKLEKRAYGLETACILLSMTCAVFLVLFLVAWSNSNMWKSEYEFYKGQYNKLQQKQIQTGILDHSKSARNWAEDQSRFEALTAYKLKLQACEVVRDAYSELIDSYKSLTKVQVD